MTKLVAGDDAFIVSLNGHLDVYRASEVRRLLQEAAEQPRVVVDMSNVLTISAVILTELVRCYKARTAQGHEPARLVVRSTAVRKILEITDLTKLWPLFETLDAAQTP
ncbi:MAG TPA: STAS domain-containing protein [Candidatus Baltobacteraceae bacterium]|nr:STAS domain-containing protein [Candidatus Baltobacteraceae bacterium]